MQPKREFLLTRYIAAFLIATFAFIMFFIFGNAISYINYQSISQEQGLIEQSIESIDKALLDFSCNPDLLVESSEKLDNVASKLTLLEKRFGKRDERVLEQKKLYSELEYRHLNLTRGFNEQCGSSYVMVIFFYSNLNGAKESESERMGYILTAFERRQAERIMIYSFDYDLDYELIKQLIARYGVASAPIVIVDNDSIYVRNIDELEKYID